MKIYPVVNISRVVRYREPMKGQKVEEPKLVEVDRVKEWKVEKTLNKRKVRGVIKYLVYWKGFTAENDTWEKEEENLENTKEVVDEFKERISVEVERLWKEKMNLNVEEFRRSELLGKYMAKILFGWNDGKFEKEYLKKLERNWAR